MTHCESYNSFKIKRNIEKKNRAKEHAINKTVDDSFVVSQEDLSGKCGVVIETSYKEAKVLFNEKIIDVMGMQGNIPCNQIVFPGDLVILDNDNEKIKYVVERKTILSRDHKDRTRKNNIVTNKIIATNIDSAVIVVSAYSPPLHPKFIDRYLMILQFFDIEPIICLNKSELKTEEDEMILNIYRDLKLKVIETSATSNFGIAQLKECLVGKNSIFVGHSGVGKSSLINKIMGFDDIKTGEVGEKSKKGRHTTTSSKYYVWEEKSSIIDTPGIRSLDVSNFQVSEIEDYFSEFKKYSTCKFRSCNHINTPLEDCGIKQAVLNGNISKSRYESYSRILADLTTDSKKKG